MTYSADEAYWRDLESNAHRPEVQELIRQEIQSGTIRVRPGREGGIRIVPMAMSESGEPAEVGAPPAPPQDEANPSKRGALRGRIARR
jgi:hypothetical protein